MLGYNDPYLNQYYLDLADNMYARMNRVAVAYGMQQLLIASNSALKPNAP
jgi:hypothetical protein